MMPIQKNQSWTFDYVDKDKYADSLSGAGPAFALVARNNIVLGAAGIWVMENHRGLAWALISDTIGTDFIHFHKAVANFLDNLDIQRVEMAVETNFKQGVRWAKMLGFNLEGLMHNYYPNGSDAYLFARTQ